MKKRPKVALVLSGGGALGFAHIGVIDVLQKHKIPIDMIVGTSMGAIVGGAVACGRKVSELEEVVCKMRTRHLFDFNLNFKGIFSGKSALKFIKREIPNIDQKDTKIPFYCNALDLVKSKEVVFKEGNLIENIRASMSIPGVFTPVKRDNMVLVDGGIVNNMGHDIARREGADIIIAVDVISKSEFSKNVKNLIQCTLQSILIMQKELQQAKRKYYNVIIQPELGHKKQYDFNGKSTKEVIELGRIATEEKIKKIKEIIINYNN